MTATAPARILIIEDEATTASTIALYLRHEGMTPTIAGDGKTGIDLARGGGFDLVVLDLMLPGMDGISICRELRAASDVPIMMVTARTTERDRILGLDLGADDYVPKPFSPRELVARIKANLRRAASHGGRGGRVIVRGPLRIDRETRRVTFADRIVDLTRVEFELLATMAAAPGRVWSREMLNRALFDEPHARAERTIDAHVKNLRHKIEPDRRHPVFIRTVFGSGYRFDAPEEKRR